MPSRSSKDRPVTASRRRSRRAAAWVTVLLLAASLPPAPVSGDPAAAGPRIVLPPFRVTADDLFNWSIWVRIVNDAEFGIYTDSITCTMVDLDPGETRSPRRYPIPVDQFRKVLGSISALDSVTFQYAGKALAEHARLRFALYSHASDGRPFVSRDSIELFPGPTSRRFPSAFLTAGKEKIEYVLVPEVWPKAPSPAILLIHGEKSNARRLLPLAWDLANRGYTTMAVSLPGYGESSGPPDFGGPATSKALSRALDRLRRSPNVDSARVAVWGISRGATAAALLAGQRKDLQALVLQSGVYDLPSAYEATASGDLRETLQAEAGPKGGWKRRSPVESAARITAPVLLVHGGRDSVVASAQASELSARLQRSGRQVTVHLVPEGGHALPQAAVEKPVSAFLRERLKPDK